MCKTLNFIVSNSKNLIVIVCALASIIAFCVTLYGIPPRIDEAEKKIIELRQKQEVFEVRFNTLEQNFAELKDDIKEIRGDLKVILRTLPNSK